jgi:hypothetical protein
MLALRPCLLLVAACAGGALGRPAFPGGIQQLPVSRHDCTNGPGPNAATANLSCPSQRSWLHELLGVAGDKRTDPLDTSGHFYAVRGKRGDQFWGVRGKKQFIKPNGSVGLWGRLLFHLTGCSSQCREAGSPNGL